jgi:hypothetical protein
MVATAKQPTQDAGESWIRSEERIVGGEIGTNRQGLSVSVTPFVVVNPSGRIRNSCG